MATYNNLSGTADFPIEIPLKDTMVYNLTLLDEDGVEELDLTGNTFEFQFFTSNMSRTPKWTVAGELINDGFGVQFIKATDEKIGSQFYYRVKKTDGDGNITTPIRGKFKVA